LFQDQGRYPEAKANYEQCLRILEASFGRKHMDVASALHHLAAVNQLQGLYNEAIPLYNRALDIYYELLGPVHADIALSLNDLAILYFKQSNHKKAEEFYLKSIDNYTQVFTRVHPDVAQALLNIAQFYKATGTLLSKIVKYCISLTLTLLCRANSQREEVLSRIDRHLHAYTWCLQSSHYECCCQCGHVARIN